jgi:type I restriction enzyme, S subunit
MRRWQHQPIYSLGTVITGSTPRTSEDSFYDGEIPFITPAELDQDDPVITATRTLSESGAKEARLLPEGAVMVCCIGSLGKIGIAGRAVVTNQQINSVVFDVEKILPRFGFHACRLLKPQLLTMAPATTVAIVSKSKFEKLEIPVPPIAEQKRIAEILDRTQSLISKRKEAIAKLDTLTQSIFLEMFGDPVTNPKGWDIAKVGEIADVQGGLQVSSSRKKYPREVPYLRVANVYRGFLNLSEIKMICATDIEISRTLLQKDDLLIVEGHGNPNEIGRVALWDGSIINCIHQNHIIRARFNQSKIIPLYACYYLNSAGGRQHLLKSGKTTSGLNTINVSEVRYSPVSMPPLGLQKEFAQRVEAVEKLKATHRASLSQLEALFASLQHRAFRGEL